MSGQGKQRGSGILGPRHQEAIKEGKGIFTVYFSHPGENYSVGNIGVGNTRRAVETIQKTAGGGIFEIECEKDYAMPYSDLIKLAKEEQRQSELPPYKSRCDLSDAGIVFIGGPVWWGTWPQVVFTFLSDHDLNGRILALFTTHEGSGLCSADGAFG
ncbi:MAG: flavodoxin [Succinivibrio sp.]|nr:flavodoxin [Succinivibrio sp.]